MNYRLVSILGFLPEAEMSNSPFNYAMNCPLSGELEGRKATAPIVLPCGLGQRPRGLVGGRTRRAPYRQAQGRPEPDSEEEKATRSGPFRPLPNPRNSEMEPSLVRHH